jgi:hypothetical protein
MDPDLLLTIGVVFLVITIPSLLSAWTDGRFPRLAALMVLAGAGLIATAAQNKPTGYMVSEVPHVMMSVIGRYLN